MLNLKLLGKWNKKGDCHPVIYHMLDVALVALAIFATLDKKEQKQLLLPFINCQQPLSALLFLIALHDLGKLTPGFQLKIPEWRSLLKEMGFEWDSIAEEGSNTVHGCTGYLLLSVLLEQHLSLPKVSANALANAVAGHHGSFFHGMPNLRTGEGLWQEVRNEAVEWLQKQLGVSWGGIQVDTEKLTPAYIVHLAGFCSVADWLGSDESTFTYLNHEKYDLKQREQLACEQIRSLSLKQAGLAAGKSYFKAIFPFTPNVTQQACLDLFSRTESPALTIIETPMGSGKTEAAFALADKYIREQGKTGFYFALPTQATGNQLFERAIQFLKDHPAKTIDLELHLRHSNASLNTRYESLQASSVNNDENEGVIASRWFTSNKRGLLSAYAVGTVDQCLIAALQVRHFFVRLFGLSNKVVIIDEVHAYDTYTSCILEGLLEWLAALGAPVILLSATLPASRRKALMMAYQPQGITLQDDAQKYPRITCLGSDGRYSEANVVDKDSRLPKSFEIKLLETSLGQRWDKVTTILDNALDHGGCAACIVNTVNDAQKLFETLKVHHGNNSETRLILFHARFLLYRRLEIEKQLKDLFGKGDQELPNPKRPAKAIVVATQVLEQSLDVDFDVMISMLAPIDLLLQRAGRVHRHYKNQRKRPEKLARPVIYCLHPRVDKETDDAGKIFGSAEAYIYEPYCLLYTVISLKNRAEHNTGFPSVYVNMPEDMESLIDEVYEGKLEVENDEQRQKGEIWEFLSKENDRMETKFATGTLIPPSSDRLRTFFRNLERAEDDEKVALTRLALPSVALVLMRKDSKNQWCLLEDGESVDLESKPNQETQNRLVRSSVRVSHQGWVEYFAQQAHSLKVWQKTAVLRDCYPLYLTNNIFRCPQMKGALMWRPELGLVIENSYKEPKLG